MKQNKNITVEEDDNLVQQMVSKYLPYWPVFLIAILTGAALAYSYLRYTIPIYEATATLIIKDEKKGNEDSKLTESLDQMSSKKIVENEIEILQSRKLMTDVVTRLGLYAPISETGEIRSNSAYLSSPISILSPEPDSIINTKKIILDYNNDRVTLNKKYTYFTNEIVSTPFGILKFVPNKNYENPNRPLKQLYFSLINPKDMVPDLLNSLKAEPASKLSSIIDLSFRDQVPERAENVLNQLIASYKQSELDEKANLAKNTLAFVEERLGYVAHDLDSIEKKVQQYKSSTGAVDINSQGQLYLQKVSDNDQKLSDVNTQLSVLDQVEKFVKNNNNSDAIVPSTLGVSDPMLSQLLDKLYNSKSEYDKLSKTVGENNPGLLALREQITNLKPDVLRNIQGQQQNLLAARQNISSTNGGYNSMLQTIPQKDRELLDISREQQMKNNIYSFLLQKKEESQLAAVSTDSNNRVVDYAQAGDMPVSPKKLSIYLISIVSLLALCIAIITFKESMSGKVLYRKELEARTSIPIISEIAFNKSETPLVIKAGTRSFIAEEFRKLRISLSFLGIDADHKKILITSSISGEGKSFIAANLAVSLSLTGKKVVIVDMDLNNPTLAKIFNVVQNEGSTEFLKGEKEPDEIIKRVKAHDNLFFISAGKIPENPTELLANGKVRDLIEYLDSIFDIVLIDTSPIVLVTDGYLLTGLCDATLYVVRHKYTPKILIRRIDENNQINPINNPAIIFNGVKVRGFFKNNYGYGYDYVYGSKEKRKSDKKSTVKN